MVAGSEKVTDPFGNDLEQYVSHNSIECSSVPKRRRKTSVLGLIRDQFKSKVTKSKSVTSRAKDVNRNVVVRNNRRKPMYIGDIDSFYTYDNNKKSIEETLLDKNRILELNNVMQAWEKEKNEEQQEEKRRTALIKKVRVTRENAISAEGKGIVLDLARYLRSKLVNNVKTSKERDIWSNAVSRQDNFDTFLLRLVACVNVYYRVFEGGKDSPGVMAAVYASIYIEQLMQSEKHLPITLCNINRFAMISVLVGSKIVNDVPMSHKYWRDACTDLSLKELNELEVVFCQLLDFNLHVNPEKYEEVLSLAVRASEPKLQPWSVGHMKDIASWEIDALI